MVSRLLLCESTVVLPSKSYFGSGHRKLGCNFAPMAWEGFRNVIDDQEENLVSTDEAGMRGTVQDNASGGPGGGGPGAVAEGVGIAQVAVEGAAAAHDAGEYNKGIHGH